MNITEHGERMAEAERHKTLLEVANALIVAGHQAAAIVVLDMLHARRMSAFVLRNESIGASRTPQLGVAHEVTTPAGALEV